MQQNMIRIFISSTFSDFTDEREVLNKKVFPRIRTYCQRFGFEFQAVDLRWGISDNATL